MIPPALEPRLPLLIDARYRLDRLVGEGGFGSVYAGVHVVLGAPVAVKVLRLDPRATAEERAERSARFLEEGRVLTRLRHPSIVTALDLGLMPPDEEGNATPYLAMEWVPGVTLEGWLTARGRALTLPEAWELFEPLASALAFAHEARVVHRDLKPGNVMIVPVDGRLGLPRVIDFGIAKLVAPDETASGGATVTASAPSAFTPAYAAPEQVVQARTGPWTDVHALALIFVEMVTGASPYGAKGNDRLRAVDPERPTPGRAGVDVGAFEPVIARALSLRPRERFSDAGELLAACGKAAREMGLLVSEKRELGTWRDAPDGTSAAPTAASVPAPLPRGGTVRSEEPIVRGDVGAAATRPPMTTGVDRFRAARTPLVASLLVAAATYAFFSARRGPPPVEHAAIASTAATAATAPVSAAAPSVRLEDVQALTLDPGCEEFPSFAADDRSVVYSASVGHDYHLYRLDLETRKRTQLTTGKGWQTHPMVSPDGARVVYTATDGPTELRELTLDGTSPPRKVGEGEMRPSYAPDGAIWAGETLHPTKLDRAGAVLRTLTPPEGIHVHAVLEGPQGHVVALAEDRNATPVGLLLYAPGKDENPTWLLRANIHSSFVLTPRGDAVLATVEVGSASTYELWRAPLDGSPPQIVPGNTLIPARGVSFSRRGDRVVWSSCDQTSDMVALEARGADWHAPPPLHARKWLDELVAPIPGKRAVVVRSSRDGNAGFWVIEPGGTEPARKLPLGDLRPTAPAVSNDGAWIAFSAAERGVFVAPLDGGAPPRQITDDPKHGLPRFSRDDRTLYFEVQLSDGATEIAAIPVAGGPVERIAPSGSATPSASPRRDELIFARTENEGGSVMLMDLATRRTRVLVKGFLPNIAGWYSADGARYLMYDDIEAMEIDVASGRVVHRFRAGADSITGASYGGSGVLLTRSIWSGDLWIARLPP